MYVKPNPARIAATLELEERAFQVRDPVLLDLLPPKGRKVEDGDLYWSRRLTEGDVVELSPDEVAAYELERTAENDAVKKAEEEAAKAAAASQPAATPAKAAPNPPPAPAPAADRS